MSKYRPKRIEAKPRALYDIKPNEALYKAKRDYILNKDTPDEIATRYGIPIDEVLSLIHEVKFDPSTKKVLRSWLEVRRYVNQRQFKESLQFHADAIEDFTSLCLKGAKQAILNAIDKGEINGLDAANKLVNMMTKAHKIMQLAHEKPTEIHKNEIIKDYTDLQDAFLSITRNDALTIEIAEPPKAEQLMRYSELPQPEEDDVVN